MNKRKLANPGLEKLRAITLEKGVATGLESDPSFVESLKEDARSVSELDTEQDADETLQEALDEIDAVRTVRPHMLGNGKNIPFPDDGEDTTGYSTCRKHVPGVNRGCTQANRPVPCPFVGKGPFNLIYKNLQSGLIKNCSCVTAMRSYLRLPYIVFLDPTQETPGEAWVPTRMAEYAPLPNGQQPTPGPGQPRTRIVFTAVKSRVPCLPPEGEAKKFQHMRRRGAFDAPARKSRVARSRG
jgi:hypothetical protein